jgi:prevent-host-death family protein
MKFSTDELMPFFEVRTGMSKHLDDVQAGKEIVITRHGKPEGALVSAAQLYRYRELERVITELTALLNTTANAAKPDNAQKAISVLMIEAGKLLTKTGGGKP